ncbi:TonB-dependent receptor [Leadbetterella byssophila DSM 17132]|uniref:TonB-dependent receptor n=1 Tax=Leadbetterella byssophila (strain DSM 17132 / JCM 16389 / KACC 11308 / NBRC 106382 / 4M15) TaxID=649349 RepID=E4RRC8_LEAB4|nr:TonB-dependent receptor [Leadbetterella byssophila]ADQ18461.1 TonB-dependent receptor [Leadbetterella byssophila DSM 17132]
MRSFLLCLLTLTAQAQHIKLSGTINDTKEPIVGVRVSAFDQFCLTDNDGNFTLYVPPGNIRILFEHISYEAKTLEFGSKQDFHIGQIQLSPKVLDEIVVTGQHSAQSLRNSVYNVRVIGPELIRLRGATNLQSILSTELGMRFSNDLTLGTSDIELMGMSGQNVKILLDGIPLLDRGSTRESLGQIDIYNVERIEIVEGPMSVSYGSDALAGVINIISKQPQDFSLSAKIQEETAGKEYNLFQNKGAHYSSLQMSKSIKNIETALGFTRNFFGGYQGKAEGRKKDWMPKEQYLGFAQIGYKAKNGNIWYRFNGTDETLKSLGNIYINTNTQNPNATDQYYISKRWFHQLQGQAEINSKTTLTISASYTDYQRNTQTTDIDLLTKRRTLSTFGNQDEAKNNQAFLRLMGLHQFRPDISFQHGVELNLSSASGERITGTPNINDYSYFASVEYNVNKRLKFRPGFRTIYNSVYDAPPLIPSIHTKWQIYNNLDLRLAYSRGFRSPALRELYFTFFDASHSIKGNKDLQAETSDSFNAFLTFQKHRTYKSTLGLFYNQFKNLITLGIDPSDPSLNTYLNIDKHKTTGLTFNQNLIFKNATITLGLSEIGRYNQLEGKDFLFSTEINSTIIYKIPKWKASANLYYKYTGKLPRYVAENINGEIKARQTKSEDYHIADLTFNKQLGKNLELILGAKNLFNITNIRNNNATGGDAHSTGTSLPLSYGRSFLFSIKAQIF